MIAFRAAILTLLALALGGCASLWFGDSAQGRRGNSSSLVDFLYPNGSIPDKPPETLPYLELPIRVGIAFVPATGGQALPADEQHLLLERVASAFRDRPYVSAIEVIPDSYLRTARGMQGLKQVAAMFDVDAMALVSYDQLALTGERDSAILYWTVVGALLVKGNVNEVQTMIDTAVFDVASTKLLFRAPGTHRGSDTSTFIDVERDLRGMRSGSYVAATDDMIVNLNHQLETFRERVKRGEGAQVAWQPGHGGGGSADLFLLLLLAGGLVGRAGWRLRPAW